MLTRRAVSSPRARTGTGSALLGWLHKAASKEGLVAAGIGILSGRGQ